jgi:hypothetical protein
MKYIIFRGDIEKTYSTQLGIKNCYMQLTPPCRTGKKSVLKLSQKVENSIKICKFHLSGNYFNAL